MSIKIIVNGARGKMGALASDAVNEHASFELVAGLNRGDDLTRTIIETKADIVIDLTRADCVFANSSLIINAGAHPVIGTSGLQEEEFQSLKAVCDRQKLGGIVVPNFSVAAVLMMQCAAMVARYLKDVEIIEAHHPQKFDAPSGTAIKTADMIAKARMSEKNQTVPHIPLMGGPRGASYHDIQIHSLRLPGILASQQVIFGNKGETLTITHNSIDRSSFMPGVVLACEKVTQLATLYYGLEHLLD